MVALPTRTLKYLCRVRIEPHTSMEILRVMHVNIIFDIYHSTQSSLATGVRRVIIWDKKGSFIKLASYLIFLIRREPCVSLENIMTVELLILSRHPSSILIIVHSPSRQPS